MQMENATKQRIVKKAFLSLFVFLLPILAMFITFYFTGERPWEKKKSEQQQEKNISVNKKSNTENADND